jgi:hypothetical protein
VTVIANGRYQEQLVEAVLPLPPSFLNVDRGRESVSSPSLRTVQADLPHTALQLVVHPVRD